MELEYESLSAVNASFLEELSRKAGEVIGSGWFVLGRQVAEFEEQFARYLEAGHCTGVGSGLDAITLSLQALKLEEGSEVLVPSNTYIATILAVLHSRLKPVLVEPRLETYNIDPALIEDALTDRTRALIAVHLYGKPCQMDRLTELCGKHGLRLVEDCAQSHGASFHGRKTGTFGDFGAFSFYPTKNLGALGDGGAVVCKEAALDAELRRLRNYGSDKKYHNTVLGYNSRLDEIQAAFLSVKLKRLDEINQHKRELASVYFEGLKSDYVLPVQSPESFDVYHIFNVRHPRRNALRDHLLRHGIKTEIHYPVPPAEQEALRGLFDPHRYPLSAEIHRTTLSLPISFGHTREQIQRVVEVMNAFPYGCGRGAPASIGRIAAAEASPGREPPQARPK
jgi:dTDP-4-amino-4,6-dideoxygalactose transaminase